MKESPRHTEAFNFYFALGANRSLHELHRYYTKNTPDNVPSIDSIKRWSSNFNWQERVMIRDRDVAQKVEKKVLKAEENTRLNSYRKVKQVGDMLSATLATAFYKDVKDGGKTKLRPEIGITSARELKEVAIGALKCETEALHILAPGEELEVIHKGEVKVISIQDTIKKYEKVLKEIEG